MLPPPPPFLPPRCASLTNHCLSKSLFRISSGRANLVSNCASCLLNASNVGILLIYTQSVLARIARRPHFRPLDLHKQKRDLLFYREGDFLTLYLTGKSSSNVESISTSTKPSPPSLSPTFSSSIRLRTSGLMAWHVAHQDAVQNVIRARLSAALRRVRVCRSLG